MLETPIEFASSVIKKEQWTPTPLLSADVIGDFLGINLWFKREDCTPVGSFKLRGATVALERLKSEIDTSGIWVASAGNFGLAIAVAGKQRGIDVSVVVPENATPIKMDRIKLAGATVVKYGKDFDESKDYARLKASELGSSFWEDGNISELADGASTIALEILAKSSSWDCVLVPVGNGSLIKGIASVFKDRSPATQIIGLVASGAPAMYHAMVDKPSDENTLVSTVADGLAVRVPISKIVKDLIDIVDDVWIVQESELLPAVNTLIKFESVLVEPSAAIGLAGLVEHKDIFIGKKVAMIITGAHLNWSLMPKIIECRTLV